MKIQLTFEEKISNIESRKEALRPGSEETKAEKAFDNALSCGTKKGFYLGIVTKMDYDAVIALYDEYYSLQEQIEDEDNTDGHTQSLLMKQQDKIQKQLEDIYIKYLPKKKST